MKLRNGAILMAMSLMFSFTGCDTVKIKHKSDAGDIATEKITYKNSKISVDEVKGKYGSAEEQPVDVMPLYNVEKDEVFKFDFKSDLTEDSSIGLYDAITVHTDKECKEESKIYYYSNIDKTEHGSEVKISPMSPVLKTDTDDDNYVYKNKCNWGSAPMLYLAIHYDQDSDGIKKLEKPIVIPFTVKSDVEVPHLKAEVGTDGVYKLSWDEVPGADHYVVYNLTNAEIITGDVNQEIDGEKTAYEGCSVLKVAETKNTEFSAFAGGEDGTAKLRDSYVFGQNYSVGGTYYVTAVKGDKESNLSAPCKTAGLKLPHKVADSEDIANERFNSISELPQEVGVENTDESITKRKVLYKLEKSDKSSLGSRAEYNYSIEGTAISGTVVVNDYENKDVDFPDTMGTESSSGNYIPEDNIKKSPDSSVDTITDGKKTNDDIVADQKENTKSHSDSGKDEKIETPEKGVYINADSPEEEWLALNMTAGNEEISLEAFPKLQEPYTLKDTFFKVYYQNPFILGVCSFSYDYNTFTFKVQYSYSKDQMKKMQKEIVETAEKVNEDIIKKGMSDEEKRLAIYDYLEDSAEYDMDALEDAKTNGYEKKAGNKFEDSFNAYGVLVKKKGVCASYAAAYKLLSDLSGVQCKVATGYLNGNLPHAWNMVNIDNKWYQIDSTNNGKTTGIPYFLYDASSKMAEETSFTLDDQFEIDETISTLKSESDEYEYYTKNHLAAKSISEYENILEKELSGDKDLVVVRYSGKDFDEKQFASAIKEAVSKKGMEDKLNSAGFGYNNGYVVLNFNAKK